MNKRLVLAAIVIVLVAIILFSLAHFLQSSVPTQQPKGEEYMHFVSNYQGGIETKVYLVNSMLFYGVYNESFTRSGATGSYSINKGAPCVIINGTIRNDYDEDYYFSITAEVYNSSGQTIGPILTVNSPQPGFTVAFVDKGTTGYFEIQIKYDAKDITSYDLFVAFEPYETPPP
jgi:flagellar basal body-associated protein FliL